MPQKPDPNPPTDDQLVAQLREAAAAAKHAAAQVVAVAVKPRIVRIRPSHNSKIVDVEWFYEVDGVEHVVLVDGMGVPADADNDAILTAIRGRRARVLAEMGALIPDVDKNADLVGQVVEL